MRGAWTSDQIRAGEAQLLAAVPEGALMARASFALATECTALLGGAYGRHVAVLVGAGNNGGDALYAGAELARRGADVVAVLLAPDRAHAGGLAAFVAAGGRTTAAATVAAAGPAIGAADLVLDGIVGIGGHGELRPPAPDLLSAARGAIVVAVDVPSGVDADTGAVAGAAVHADVTVTFGGLKPGLLVGAGAEHAGEVRLADIGLEPCLPEPSVRILEAGDARAALTPPGAQSDKYTRGVVGVVAGSDRYSGAAVLSVGAAIHGGAGMVRYVGGAGDAVRSHWPEVVVHPRLEDAGRVQAWVVGPGLGTDDAAGAQLDWVLAQDVPVLVDADALTLLAERRDALRRRAAPTLLTPHDREFERVFGEVGADRLAAARRAAAESGATVLLKGNATVIAGPDGEAYVNRTGTPWLATAGSGDVLSGLTGSVIAGGAPVPLAAAVGAYVHGVAGQVAATDGPPSSADVLSAIRTALHRLQA